MESELKKKLDRIQQFIKIDKIIKGEKNSPRAIRKYYKINKPAYKRFHSNRGFMHFRISKGDTIRENDVYYQPDTISSYIKSGATVVELGPGQGANIFYLSAKHKDATFTGIDLNPPKMPKNAPNNLKLIRENYENMDTIDSQSVDVVFGIETVVHCSDKDRVFSEIYRVLKPNGVFILYDYATVKEFNEYLPYEQTAIDLVSKCGAAARVESDLQWEKHFENGGFEKISKTDFGKNTLPDLHRLFITAKKIIDNDRRVKFVFRFLPKTFTNNILIGYIAEDCVKEGIFYYNEWIYKKK